MDNNKTKLEGTLRIPLSKVEIKGSYADIYSDGIHIGTLPVFTAASILHFDTNEWSLKNLKWENVYFKHRDEINAQVFLQFENIKYEAITMGPFRRLYVDLGDKKIGLQCAYDNGQWTVHKEPTA